MMVADFLKMLQWGRSFSDRMTRSTRTRSGWTLTRLQWGRSFSDRMTHDRRGIQTRRAGFNGAGLFQTG